MAAPYYCSPQTRLAPLQSLGQSGFYSSPWGNPQQLPQTRQSSNNYVSEATHTSFSLPEGTYAQPFRVPFNGHAAQISISPPSPNFNVIPPDNQTSPASSHAGFGVSPPGIHHAFYPPPDVDPAFYPPQQTTPALSPLAIPGSVPSQHQSAASTPFVYPQIPHHPTPHPSSYVLPGFQISPSSPPDSALFGNAPIVDPAPIPALDSCSMGGKYGINHLLNCNPGQCPYIDWVIYQDTTVARRWVLSSSGKAKPKVLNSSRLAVIPPVNSLQVSTRERDNPIGHAIRRWGPIQVHRTNHPLTVGDVMQEIWAYFQHPLTDHELDTMDSFFAERVEDCCDRRCDELGLPRNRIRVKRRCDTLLDWVRFETIEIDYDFASTKTLFLFVEDEMAR